MELQKAVLIFSIAILAISCTNKKQNEKESKSVESKREIQIVAHRGGAKLAPENTIASFEKAIDLGVDMIEIDVRLSSDNEVIVMHDKTIDRTSDKTGEVKNLSLAEIKKADAGSWFDTSFKNERIPTLGETLEATIGKTILLIEIKDGDERYPGLEKRIVESIKKYEALEWVVVQSFNKNSVLRIKELYPEVTTFYLAGKSFAGLYAGIESDFKAGKKIRKQFDGIASHHGNLNATNVELLHRAGFKVFTYTVNDVKDMQHVKSLKVDGIITDAPHKLKAILN